MKIPVFLPVTREFGFRDEFAQDCLLQRRVVQTIGSPATTRGARRADNRGARNKKIVDVQQAHGNLAAALTSCQASLDNAGWQSDLAVSRDNIGRWRTVREVARPFDYPRVLPIPSVTR